MSKASRMEYLILGWVILGAGWSCPNRILSMACAGLASLCFLAFLVRSINDTDREED